MSRDYKEFYYVFFESPQNPTAFIGAYGVSWPSRVFWFRKYILGMSQALYHHDCIRWGERMTKEFKQIYKTFILKDVQFACGIWGDCFGICRLCRYLKKGTASKFMVKYGLKSDIIDQINARIAHNETGA